MRTRTKNLGIALLSIVFTMVSMVSDSQEAKVNQRKINNERAKKEKENKKKYEKDLKRHYDIQSKETKRMMKQSKHDFKKNTPLK
jgi:hypothetical protein